MAATKDFNTDLLVKTMRALKGCPHARVGVLAAQAPRKAKGPSNAQVGAAHEFGAPGRGLPMRSWLRQPLNEQLDKAVKAAGPAFRKAFAEGQRSGDMTPFLKLLGACGEGVVKRGLENGGYGKWAPLPAKTMQRKIIKQILVETTQLRDAVTNEVVKK